MNFRPEGILLGGLNLGGLGTEYEYLQSDLPRGASWVSFGVGGDDLDSPTAFPPPSRPTFPGHGFLKAIRHYLSKKLSRSSSSLSMRLAAQVRILALVYCCLSSLFFFFPSFSFFVWAGPEGAVSCSSIPLRGEQKQSRGEVGGSKGVIDRFFLRASGAR